MKRILILSFISCLLVSSVYGITRLTYEQHALKADADNNMVLAKFQSPGPGGANQLWDFSGMNKTNDFKGTINRAANLKSAANPYNTELVEFGNSFYFNITKKKIELYGYKSANGAVQVEYDKPYVKMVYPFGYGDTYAGNYSGKVITNGSQSDISGIYSVEADGYGTLILPGDQAIPNTLRVKSVKSYSQGANNTSTKITITTYRWYAESERYPLLVLITSETETDNRVHTSHTAAYKTNIEIKSGAITQNTAPDILVYPNPVTDNFSIAYELDKTSVVLIEAFDMSGKKAITLLNAQQEAGNYHPEFNAQETGLGFGVYNVRVSIDNQVTTKQVVIKK